MTIPSAIQFCLMSIAGSNSSICLFVCFVLAGAYFIYLFIYILPVMQWTVIIGEYGTIWK